MNINKLASAISRGKWLIEPRTYAIERVRAAKFLSRDTTASVDVIEEQEIEPAYIIRTDNYSKILVDNWSGEIIGLATSGNVCVIPICGTIMKCDWCGSPGTDTLSSWLKSAVESPQIDAIILLINSGGGSVEGTGEFADLVKSLSEQKTIVTFCEGLIASAAYWIGCSTPEVWVSHKTAEIGSIGTAVCFMDDSEYMKEMGFTDVYINADSSPDKNQDVIKAIAGDTTSLKENIINPTNEIFMAAVKANRGDKLKLITQETEGKTINEPLTGKVYLAETAIENGLIDGICTLEQCISHALELSESDEIEAEQIPTTIQIINNQTRKHLKYQYNGN
jgi:ClpP class serine protease